MKQAILSLNFALALCLFTPSVNATTITWASGTSGNWSDPANWNPAQVPGPGDTAIITASGNYIVTLDTNTSVNSLVLGSSDATTQSLRVDGQFMGISLSATVNTNGAIDLNSGNLYFSPGSIVNGTLTCYGGTLGGALTVASNGVANLIGMIGGTLDLNSLTLTNCGTVVWSNIDLQCQSSVQIENYGLWDAQTNNMFFGNSSGVMSTFDNYGTFQKDGGAFVGSGNDYSELDGNTAFNNFGTVNNEIGLLGFLAGTGYGGSIFNTLSNSYTGFGDSYTMTGDVTFTGAGTIPGALNGFNAVLHGAITVSYMTFRGTVTLASDSVLCVSPIQPPQPISFAGTTFTNYGTVIWTNTDLYGQSSPQIYNYGLWDATMDNTFHGAASPFISSVSGTTTFNNYGTFRKSDGTNVTTFDDNTTFNNFGTVDVEASQISIDYGFGGGLFNIASNTIVWLGFPGSFTLTGDTTFTGPGAVSGYLYGYNGVIHGSPNFYYCTLAGNLTVASNAVVNLVGTGSSYEATYLDGLILTNCGTVVWSNVDLKCQSSSQIYNDGLWDAQSDNTFYGDGSGGSYFESTFNNNGIVRKDGGSASTTFDDSTIFNNSGIVDDEVSQISINYGFGGGLFNIASNNIIWLGFPGSFTVTGDTTFTGPGAVSGYLYGYNGVIHGTPNFYYCTLAGNLTVAKNAVANLLGTGSSYFNGLVLTNCGTVVWGNTDLKCQSSSQIYNNGLWDAQSDNTFYGDGSGGSYFVSTFNNNGIVRKDGGTASTTFDDSTTFNNFGTVDDEVSQISIDYGFGGGLFNIASNNIVWLGFPGSFTVTGDTTFTGPGSVSGYLYGYNGIIHGSPNFYYCTLAGNLTVAKNAVANLLGTGSSFYLNGLVLTNCGTVVWGNTDLKCQSSSQIYNDGLWDAQSDNTFYGDDSGGSYFESTFNNNGTVRKDGGSASTTFDDNTTFNNSGTVDDEVSQISINYGFGGGLFNIASNNIIWLGFPGSFTLTGDTTFTGPGSVSGYLYGNNGVIHGALNFSSGTLAGNMIVASNAVATLFGTGNPYQPIYLSGLVLTNCGTVLWSNTDLECQSSSQVYNRGLWDAQTYNSFYSSSYLSENTFNNCGTFRKDGESSTTVFDYMTTFDNSGRTDIQNGLLELEGICSFANGTLNFGIAGPLQNGQLAIPGNAPLAGRISANFINHYAPAGTNSFTVVYYQSETGTFNSLCLPQLSAGLTWQTNYASTAFSLSIVAAPPLQLLSGLSLSGNSMSLSWDGLLGQTYQMQCTTNLDPANWVNLGDSITGSNSLITVQDSLTNSPQKFYRIQSQ